MTTPIPHRRAKEQKHRVQPMPVVCAWCKARERRGEVWRPLKMNPDASQVSHGICPDCFARELDKFNRKR